MPTNEALLGGGGAAPASLKRVSLWLYLLLASIVLLISALGWSSATACAAGAQSYLQLLLSRVFLGTTQAFSGPGSRKPGFGPYTERNSKETKSSASCHCS